MQKLTLFGERERPKKFDAETLINFYLDNLEEGRNYLYANLGYFIDWTRFQGISQEERDENAGDIMLFIDNILIKQIEKRGGKIVTEKDRREIFKYIKISLWGRFMNDKIKKAKDNVVMYLDDEDLGAIGTPSGELDCWDEDKMNELLADLLYGVAMTEDEQKISLAFISGYSKNEIKRGWKFSQDTINRTIEKLKTITTEFIRKRN